MTFAEDVRCSVYLLEEIVKFLPVKAKIRAGIAFNRNFLYFFDYKDFCDDRFMSLFDLLRCAFKVRQDVEYFHGFIEDVVPHLKELYFVCREHSYLMEKRDDVMDYRLGSDECFLLEEGYDLSCDNNPLDIIEVNQSMDEDLHDYISSELKSIV